MEINKEMVLNTINEINIQLLQLGIENSKIQFVGCLLIALNNGMQYSEELKIDEILNRIIKILKLKLKEDNNLFIKEKKELLIKILETPNFKLLNNKKFVNLLNIIKDNLIPFINNKNNEGEDLLNLFFTTFNKYLGWKDKNQTYTPIHIADFMSDIVELNVNSKVLDPTCGSGSLLIQTMSKMLKISNNDVEKKQIKKNQLFGIEIDFDSFGLAVTNMLIYKDGKSNIMLGNCLDNENEEWIKKNNFDIVLMNPPFNTQHLNQKRFDQTKGFYFVKHIANLINKGYLVTILPLTCAIGSPIKNNKMSEINKIKKEMLEKHNLVAVFSLPDEVFYPSASTNTCIMLWELGKPYKELTKTYFGYYKDDGFIKRKNLGRVEKRSWKNTKKKWISYFKNKIEEPGFSVLKHIKYTDEWLAETYMETNYNDLKEEDFIQVIRDFIAFKIKNGYENNENEIWLQEYSKKEAIFKIKDIFKIKKSINIKEEIINISNINKTPYVTRTKYNNGVKFLIDKNTFVLEKGNCITIGGEGASIFYQPFDFVSGNNINKLYSKKLNKYNALFIVTILNKEKYRYSYSNAFNKEAIMNTTIKLPIDESNEPDWLFMENYIKTLNKNQKNSYMFSQAFNSESKIVLNSNIWKFFRIKEIFIKIKTKKYSNQPEVENGNIPFISSSNNNNGILGFGDKNYTLTKGNTISITTNGTSFCAFYQDKDFIASNDIEILKNQDLNKYNAMFLINILNKEQYRYSYGKKAKNNSVWDTMIKLPIDELGNPNWLFMENYIKTLIFSKYL